MGRTYNAAQPVRGASIVSTPVARSLETPLIRLPRHLNLERLACLGVACALLLLAGLFVWLIIENLVR